MEARGQINCYICQNKKCNEKIFTINMNAGVTPFGITCIQCGHTECYSNFYSVKNYDKICVTHMWYRPTKDVFDILPSHTQDHVLNGGLFLIELHLVKKILLDNIRHDISIEDWEKFVLKQYGRKLTK